MPTAEEIQDEARRVDRVRMIVDFTAGLIMQGAMRRSEAEALVGMARRKVLALFPGRDETYEIVCAPRFRRLIEEFTLPDPPTGATVVRFPETFRP